jgi:hypothetical protein
MVDVVLLIGGALVILGTVPLGRRLRSLARRAAHLRLREAGPGGGPPSVSPEPVDQRMVSDERHERDPVRGRLPG